MSIYSGFATRQQQQSYDQLVQDLIFVLQKRILKFYNQENTDENKFLDVLIQLHQQMAKMEQNKYLEPKSSKSIQDLLRFLLKNEHEDKNKNKQKATATKDAKNIGNTVPVLKNSRFQPNSTQNKLNTHRDSLARLQQPTSIGKIIKQFQNDTSHYNESNNSLADSRNTFINQKNSSKAGEIRHNGPSNDRSGNKTPPMKGAKNPQQQEPTNMKANQTEVQYKSRFKAKEPAEIKKQQTRDYLLDYLERNNKNYLRGYRKRQVKTRAYSKEYSAI